MPAKRLKDTQSTEKIPILEHEKAGFPVAAIFRRLNIKNRLT